MCNSVVKPGIKILMYIYWGFSVTIAVTLMLKIALRKCIFAGCDDDPGFRFKL